MFDKKVAARFKERRQALGMTQEELAEKTHLSVTYISYIERGAAFPRYDTLVDILNCLETSADSIFCDVVNHSVQYRCSSLEEKLLNLTAEERSFVCDMTDSLIKFLRLNHFRK